MNKNKDEQDLNESMHSFISDMYENRKEVDVHLVPQKVIEQRVKEKQKSSTSRLISYNAIFTHKETGETYTLKQGGMPTMEDRKRFDMTGAMVGLVKPGTEELLTIIVPFKKDGTIPESFLFDVVELPEILTFEVKSE